MSSRVGRCSLLAAKDLIERLAQLYGVGKARAMRRVDYESGAFKVSGYAALPGITEASASQIPVRYIAPRARS